MLRWLLVLSVVGCTPTQDAEFDAIPLHGLQPDSPIRGIERLSTGDAFFPGTTEVFRAVLVDPQSTVSWSASGGELSVDDGEVAWTLPFAEGATLTATVTEASGLVHVFPLDIQLMAVNPSAAGIIDDSEANGSRCDLAIDGSDVPHVLYRSDWHDQWRYAKFVGGAWTTELIDGPGFGVGDAADVGGGIALDSNGVPHVALARSNGEVVYGNRIGGSWTLTVIGTTTGDHEPVSLVIDTGAANTPYVAFTESASYRVSIAKKVGGVFNTFTLPASPPGATGGGGFRGGLALSGNNSVRYTFGGEETYTGTWSQAAGFGNAVLYYTSYYREQTRNPIVHVSSNTFGVINITGLSWTTTGTSFETNFVVDSGSSMVARDVLWDGTQPRLGFSHDTTLEFARPDARGYWSYSVVQPSFTPSSGLAAALDTSGNLHACYQKDNRIWFY